MTGHRPAAADSGDSGPAGRFDVAGDLGDLGDLGDVRAVGRFGDTGHFGCSQCCAGGGGLRRSGHGVVPDGESAVGTEEELARALRREADIYPVGPAPVDEVVRRGRSGRRRRITGAGGAVVATAALSLAVHLAVPGAGGTASQARPVPPPFPATSPPSVVLSPEPGVEAEAGPDTSREANPTGGPKADLSPSGEQRGALTVEPYRAVDIGRGIGLVLLPDGDQNYVVGAGDLRSAVTEARRAAGDDLPPDSLSGGFHPGTGLVVGAFRTDAVPALITVRTAEGKEYRTTLLRLRGHSGWGTYHVFTKSGGDRYTATAYAADGRVLAQGEFDGVGTGVGGRIPER
ncbi:hypothetical protein ACIBCM_17260 [Streptomyces sp. NPDC051018]|uniref:hypothetical protein n=1 Tax=Streptomyces sp. NPDC051018 TaxID=3365639 RepID=UPI00378D71B4